MPVTPISLAAWAEKAEQAQHPTALTLRPRWLEVSGYNRRTNQTYQQVIGWIELHRARDPNSVVFHIIDLVNHVLRENERKMGAPHG